VDILMPDRHRDKPHSARRLGAAGANAANAVTLFRAILVVLVAATIGTGADSTRLWGAIGVASLAAVLDGVDGWLARRHRTASAFGARLDMETDAALIMVLSILVWQHGKADAWVLLCGLMRYLFVAAGWLRPWLAAPLGPTLRGKTVAVAQVVGLNVALAPIVPVPLSTVAAAVTLAALAWSFGSDVIRLSRQRISGSRLTSPKSQVPSLKSQIQNPKSQPEE
jgi:phosphatidylglycerophosphate synthase